MLLVEAMGKNITTSHKKWITLCLRYFHNLNYRQAHQFFTNGEIIEDDEGIVLSYDGTEYFIPRIELSKELIFD